MAQTAFTTLLIMARLGKDFRDDINVTDIPAGDITATGKAEVPQETGVTTRLSAAAAKKIA